MQDMRKRTVVIGLAGSKVFMPSPNRWVSQTFTPGYIRDVNALIQKLRAKPMRCRAS